jgi:NAD(P)-dependent dehydrogenase (short-subunit alcohol dehydrogenase family)
MAQAFIKTGGNVIIGSRSQASIDHALEVLQAGEKASGKTCDVSSLDEVRALSEFAQERYGSYQVWINNAGVSGPYGPTMGLAPETFRNVIDTNITGVYYGSITALDHFNTENQGKLINILGQGYKGPVPNQNAYGSSKYWGKAFTLALAKETKNKNIGIFAFQPGMMLTDLLLNIDVIEGYEDQLAVYPTIVSILAKPPEQAAKKAVWIASAATDRQTGKVFTMGGMGTFLLGAIKEGLKKISGRASSQPEIHVRARPFGEG